MLTPLLILAWLAGPPVLPEPAAPGPVIQRPSVAEASAAVEPAAVEPAVVEPPAPPSTAAPAPSVADPFTDRDVDERADRRWVRVEAPNYRGTGLFVGAGGMMFATVLYQLGDVILCGGCSLGLVEHAFLGTGLGMAAGGGVLRGSHDAFRDTALRRDRTPRRAILTGIGLLVTGLVVGVANDAMVLRCQLHSAGPYASSGENCRFGASRAIMDASAIAIGSGVGLLGWGVRYRRDARIYERARIALAPGLQRGGAGLSISGRF